MWKAIKNFINNLGNDVYEDNSRNDEEFYKKLHESYENITNLQKELNVTDSEINSEFVDKYIERYVPKAIIEKYSVKTV